MSIDAKILSALREAGEGSISGAELAAKLGVSRAAVWARIDEMRGLGYDIEASPHSGYRLLSVPDLLHADDLVSRIGKTERIGREIRVFQSTTSSSDVVEKLARDGAAEGAMVFAESQSRGRGRLGRRWSSASGKGLWFSVLLRPPIVPQAATQITVLAAVVLSLAVEKETGLEPRVKWPNDLLLDGKKIAGILTELSADPDQVKYMVLGIGLNVNQTAADFPLEIRGIATSLKLQLGHNLNRAGLAARIVQELDRGYADLLAGKFESLANAWERRCSTLGQEVQIVSGSRLIQGRAESLDDDGALVVRTQHGLLERVVAGEVTQA